MIWYFPSHAGDFRLKEHKENPDWSSLEVIDPTLDEQRLLGDFLRQAHEKGWTSKLMSTTPRKRRKTVRLKAPIASTGKLLVDVFKPGDQSLTAVTYEDRKVVTVVESADTKALDGALDKKKKPKKAASVKRPTPSCPQCQPGAIARASEVLLSFLTPKQHEQWAEHRAFEVVGHLSGHTYVLAHRHTELAARFRYICADITDSGILHFHDWTVPPEEEVLAAKLCLEHREPWLRNEATCLELVRSPYTRVGGWRDVFKNPFGDGGDGVPSADFTSMTGAFFFGMVGRDHLGRPL